MQPSAITCREEEARQRTLASTTALPNVRSIAERAALSWAKEARIAEKREARESRTRLIRDSAVVAHMPNLLDERALSENPDRGFADR